MKLKGRCLNIGKPCSKAMSGELIEADESHFLCPECGSMLMPWTVGNQQMGGQFMQPKKDSFFKRFIKNRKRVIYSSLALLLVAFALGYWLWYLLNVQDQSLRMYLSDSKKELLIGDVHKLIATFSPDDKRREVLWSIENPEIASIDDGVVKGLKEGETTVSARPKDNEGIVVFCKIIVKNKPEENKPVPQDLIAMDDSSVPPIYSDQIDEEEFDEEGTDNAETYDEDFDSDVTRRDVTDIENEEIEETPKEPTPQPTRELTMSITRDKMRMSVNDRQTLIAYVKNKKGENITKNVVWSSSNPNVASVDRSGKVTAHRSGKATITGTTKDKNINDVRCTVTVNTTEEVKENTTRKPSVQSCFGGHAQYNSKTRTVTFTKDITLKDDENGKIIYLEGEKITDVFVSNGQLKMGKYIDRKGRRRAIVNINEDF